MTTVLTELETIGRLVLATVLGFVIGLEREAAGQSAGERTHALVALGSAAFGLLSITAFPGSDTSRVAAGVVTGLGFLGAGTILKSGDTQVRGLTTAAGMWAVGAIGLAIGSGRYFLGLATAIIAGVVLLSERILRIGDRLARRRSVRDGEDLRQR
jgi:putative Mg2+ transporter-C (MgtC) family protein